MCTSKGAPGASEGGEKTAALAVSRERGALWSALGSDASSLHDFVQVSKPQFPPL